MENKNHIKHILKSDKQNCFQNSLFFFGNHWTRRCSPFSSSLSSANTSRRSHLHRPTTPLPTPASTYSFLFLWFPPATHHLQIWDLHTNLHDRRSPAMTCNNDWRQPHHLKPRRSEPPTLKFISSRPTSTLRPTYATLDLILVLLQFGMFGLCIILFLLN